MDDIRMYVRVTRVCSLVCTLRMQVNTFVYYVCVCVGIASRRVTLPSWDV